MLIHKQPCSSIYMCVSIVVFVAGLYISLYPYEHVMIPTLGGVFASLQQSVYIFVGPFYMMVHIH